MNDLKAQLREEWRPKPAKQLGIDIAGFLILAVTVVLILVVHWIAGAAFFAFCLVASFFVDRPKEN